MNVPTSAAHPSIAAVVAIGIAVPLVMLVPALTRRRARPRPATRVPAVAGPADRRTNDPDLRTIRRTRRQLLAIDECYRPSDEEVAAVCGVPLDLVRRALSSAPATPCCASVDTWYRIPVLTIVADAGNAVAASMARRRTGILHLAACARWEEWTDGAPPRAVRSGVRATR